MKYSYKLTAFLFICSLIFSSCSNKSNDFNFKTKTITLYELVKENETYRFHKHKSITDKKTVNKIVGDCQDFNFKGLTSEEVANLDLRYYLVFDDSKVVIQFGDLDTSMGRLGRDFNADYQNEGGFKDKDIANYDITDSYYVHIPLQTLKIFENYID